MSRRDEDGRGNGNGPTGFCIPNSKGRVCCWPAVFVFAAAVATGNKAQAFVLSSMPFGPDLRATCVLPSCVLRPCLRPCLRLCLLPCPIFSSMASKKNGQKGHKSKNDISQSGCFGRLTGKECERRVQTAATDCCLCLVEVGKGSKRETREDKSKSQLAATRRRNDQTKQVKRRLSHWPESYRASIF